MKVPNSYMTRMALYGRSGKLLLRVRRPHAGPWAMCEGADDGGANKGGGDGDSSGGDQGGGDSEDGGGSGTILGGGEETEETKSEGDGGEKSKEGDQSSGEGKKPPAADGELDIKLPENAQVDEKILSWFKETAKDLGLDSAKASKLAQGYLEQLEAATKLQAETWAKQGEEWAKTLREDPDFGGKAYDENVQAARQAVVRFGGKELAKDLDMLGIGNLPSLARAFARIGRAIAEDNSGGSATRGHVATMEDRLSRLYDAEK